MRQLDWDPELLLPSLSARKSIFWSVLQALHAPKKTFVWNTTPLNRNLQVKIGTNIISKAVIIERMINLEKERIYFKKYHAQRLGVLLGGGGKKKQISC